MSTCGVEQQPTAGADDPSFSNGSVRSFMPSHWCASCLFSKAETRGLSSLAFRYGEDGVRERFLVLVWRKKGQARNFRGQACNRIQGQSMVLHGSMPRRSEGQSNCDCRPTKYQPCFSCAANLSEGQAPFVFSNKRTNLLLSQAALNTLV